MKYRFEFTMAEVQHLLACLEDRDTGAHAGWYYGNKGVFEQRHMKIKGELQNMTRSAVQQPEKP